MNHSQHPLNLAARFLLEIGALLGILRLGFEVADGVTGWMAALALVAVAIGSWGVFNVPGDRSRSGGAPVPVSGRIRLAVELAVWAAGGAGWWMAGPRWAAWAYTGALVFHHLFSVDRLVWLSRVDSDGLPARV